MIRVRTFDLRLCVLRTRMPFRYGIASMTATPHLFFRLELEVDGRRQWGVSADNLPPKWFTKNADSPYRDDVADMLAVVTSAADAALAAGPCTTVFDLWQSVYKQQFARYAAGADAAAVAPGVPPLLWNFGVSLAERAAIDAFCRATGTPFAGAARGNRLGLAFGRGPDSARLHPVLAGHTPAEFLPAKPSRSVIARHTVGLSDPLTDADIPPAETLDDNLPQSLEACIGAYGLTHFKIKLCGDAGRDLDRLRRLADLLGRVCPAYAYTLDGNENFHALDPFRDLWHALVSDPSLAAFLSKLIFVEQPLHRDVALDEDVRQSMRAWDDRPPIIIDESDAGTGSLRRALDCGYVGTSYKNCKGVFKGIANACLLESLRRTNPGKAFILSGEDLSNVGPVALLEDLAVMASLGIPHVERNGHHYFAGLSMFPPEVGKTVLTYHGDLYHRRTPRPGEPGCGLVTVDLREGRLQIGSVVNAPFGVGFELDYTRFTPANEWRFEGI